MEIEEILRTIIQRKYHMLEMRLAKYELVKGQADLLLLIRDNNGITQNELAEIIGIKDSSMSVRLAKLEKSGYIVREIDENNLKRKRVYVTIEGKSVSIQCRRILREFDETLYNGFSEKERKQFEKSLKKIMSNVKR